MSNDNHGPRRLLDVTSITAAAFVAGGFLQRHLAAELAPAGTTPDAFEAWMLVPVLLQGAVGFLGLAWLLRDRFPLVLLWVSGTLGWALASAVALLAVGWSFYQNQALFLVGLVTALLMASVLQVGAAAFLKMSVTFAVGFAAAWGVLIFGLAAVILLVQLGPAWLVPSGISMQALTAAPAVFQDLVIGVTAALGVAWALGPAVTRDGSTVHYVVVPPSPLSVRAGAR